MGYLLQIALQWVVTLRKPWSRSQKINDSYFGIFQYLGYSNIIPCVTTTPIFFNTESDTLYTKFVKYLRGGFKKKKRYFLGIFPKMGGGAIWAFLSLYNPSHKIESWSSVAIVTRIFEHSNHLRLKIGGGGKQKNC